MAWRPDVRSFDPASRRVMAAVRRSGLLPRIGIDVHDRLLDEADADPPPSRFADLGHRVPADLHNGIAPERAGADDLASVRAGDGDADRGAVSIVDAQERPLCNQGSP